MTSDDRTTNDRNTNDRTTKDRTTNDRARVSIGDIEAKLRQIGGQAEEKVRDSKKDLMAAVGAGLCGLLIVIYLLGRRRGRRRSTIVEVRRV